MSFSTSRQESLDFFQKILLTNCDFLLQELTVLYPDINKDVFKRFCSAVAQAPINRASDGYVKHTLVTQVEGGWEFPFHLWFQQPKMYSYSIYYNKTFY